MLPNANPLLDRRQCACGAPVGSRQNTCRKCHARARWLRRTGTRHGVLIAAVLMGVIR